MNGYLLENVKGLNLLNVSEILKYGCDEWSADVIPLETTVNDIIALVATCQGLDAYLVLILSQIYAQIRVIMLTVTNRSSG